MSLPSMYEVHWLEKKQRFRRLVEWFQRINQKHLVTVPWFLNRCHKSSNSRAVGDTMNGAHMITLPIWGWPHTHTHGRTLASISIWCKHNHSRTRVLKALFALRFTCRQPPETKSVDLPYRFMWCNHGMPSDNGFSKIRQIMINWFASLRLNRWSHPTARGGAMSSLYSFHWAHTRVPICACFWVEMPRSSLGTLLSMQRRVCVVPWFVRHFPFFLKHLPILDLCLRHRVEFYSGNFTASSLWVLVIFNCRWKW